MHKKGAKLSLVHLFGLSKINRNYIQKGREIRRNMKRMKKVLSIVLSLAMILTSITVYNTKTAKAADGDITEFEVKATKNEQNLTMDASWSVPEGTFTRVAYYLNRSGEEKLTSGYYALPANDWSWSDNDKTNFNRKTLDTVTKSANKEIDVYVGSGDYVITVVYYNGDDIVAKGTSNVIHYDENTNTDLNATYKINKSNKRVTFKWNIVGKAVKYNLFKNNSYANVNAIYNNTMSTTIELGKKYNFTIQAVDVTGKELATQTFENVEIENTDMSLKSAYGTEDGTISLSWESVSNASRYVLSVDGRADINIDGNLNSYTLSGFEKDAIKKYTATFKAYDSEGTELEITGNTKTFKYNPGAAPDENDINNVDTSNMVTLQKGDGTNSDYLINKNHGLEEAVWFKVFYPHNTAAYHNERPNCILDKNASAFVFKSDRDNVINKIWVNQVGYDNHCKYFNMDGDCVEISTELFNQEFNVITLVMNNGDMKTFAIKVNTPAKATVNGEEQPITDGKIILPDENTNNKFGYYCNGKFYKSGEEVTVEGNMDFVSVADLNVKLTNGAAIRIDKGESGGIKFKSDVSINCGIEDKKDDILSSKYITTGTLITTSDILNDNDLNHSFTGTKIDVVNSGWYSKDNYDFCASIVNIVPTNYVRKFVATSYVKVKYNDGEEKIVYSGDDSAGIKKVSRSIKYIAEIVRKNNHDGFDKYKDIIDSFADAK